MEGIGLFAYPFILMVFGLFLFRVLDNSEGKMFFSGFAASCVALIVVGALIWAVLTDRMDVPSWLPTLDIIRDLNAN